MSHLNYDFVLDLPFCHLNDDSFNLAMYELTRGSLNYDNDGLDSLIFNPINQIGHNLSSSYLDPDHSRPQSHFHSVTRWKLGSGLHDQMERSDWLLREPANYHAH
jgi:hypothetical protein